MVWFLLFLLVVGIYFVVYGSRLLWEKGFLEKMLKESPKRESDKYWTEKEKYDFEKLRAWGTFLIGILFTGFAIFGLIRLWIH